MLEIGPAGLHDRFVAGGLNKWVVVVNLERRFVSRLWIEPFFRAACEIWWHTGEADIGLGIIMGIAVTDLNGPKPASRTRFDLDFGHHVLAVLGRWGNRGLTPECPDPLAARCDNERSPIFPLRHVLARSLGRDGEVRHCGGDIKPPGPGDETLKHRCESLAEDMIFFRITGPQHGFIECCGNPVGLPFGFQLIDARRACGNASDTLRALQFLVAVCDHSVVRTGQTHFECGRIPTGHRPLHHVNCNGECATVRVVQEHAWFVQDEMSPVANDCVGMDRYRVGDQRQGGPNANPRNPPADRVARSGELRGPAQC